MEPGVGPMPGDFIDEDDLNTFDGWLNYQAVDPDAASPDELAMLRSVFDKTTASLLATPKIGLMKLPPPLLTGEHRYAVAVRDVTDLWLALWFKRTKKGEFVTLIPGVERGWDPHSTYHLDGTYHWKSHGGVMMEKTLQPLTGPFRGTEHLGSFAGYAPKGVGAICDPAAFTGIVEVPLGVLGPRHGSVVIDLVEPGHEPLTWYEPIVLSMVFRDFVPWVVFRVVRDGLELMRDPALAQPPA
jgi:hypothetical protein